MNKEIKITQQKNLSEIEIWEVVKEWYTRGLYAPILQDHNGFDLEEICDDAIERLNNPEPDHDITYSNGASSGIFDFEVCLNDDDSIMTGTEHVSAYTKGRYEEPEYWDNDNWLRAFRDGILDEPSKLPPDQEDELRYLLVEVTKKGWL